MLTDIKARSAKPKKSKYMLTDIDGLYLEVRPTGLKTWYLRFKGEDGKRHWRTIGEYPIFGLADARAKAAELRKMDAGTLESDAKKIVFKKAALEFFERYKQQTTSEKAQRITRRNLEMHIFPLIGEKPLRKITTKDIFAIIQRLESREAYETARRVVQLCSRVFKYAMMKEYCSADPCYPLKGEATRNMRRHVKHFAALVEPHRIGTLMRQIDVYAQPVVKLAMKFSALTFCRPGEIRHAEWSEFDFERKFWLIPASKMKMKRDHMVPLSDQALEVLRELAPLTKGGIYLFPNARAPKGDRPMSENTILVALRSMGYAKEDMTAHGFRTMASTILNEQGFNRDWIEAQLAHAPADQVRDAYNRAQYWDDRVKMVQWYADYLDQLRSAK